MINLLYFKSINIDIHQNEVVQFRKDSFAVSFGDVSGFGDEKQYLYWLEEKIKEYPEGFVMVEQDNKLIGQLELSIKKYEGKNIGYVNLYYLVPECRGKGIGKELHRYALKFFEIYNINEFHLRVSSTNTFALKFYQKLGMEEIGPELDGKVLRMKGVLNE